MTYAIDKVGGRRGAKMYGNASYSKMVSMLTERVGGRCIHEVLTRRTSPVRGYIDVEEAIKGTLTEDEIAERVSKIRGEMIDMVMELWGDTIPERDLVVIILNGSREGKFSVHAIMPHILFRDVAAAGRFAGLLNVPGLDTSVYKSSQCFRMYGQSKPGKAFAPLKPLPGERVYVMDTILSIRAPCTGSRDHPLLRPLTPATVTTRGADDIVYRLIKLYLSRVSKEEHVIHTMAVYGGTKYSFTIQPSLPCKFTGVPHTNNGTYVYCDVADVMEGGGYKLTGMCSKEACFKNRVIDTVMWKVELDYM